MAAAAPTLTFLHCLPLLRGNLQSYVLQASRSESTSRLAGKPQGTLETRSDAAQRDQTHQGSLHSCHGGNPAGTAAPSFSGDSCKRHSYLILHRGSDRTSPGPILVTQCSPAVSAAPLSTPQDGEQNLRLPRTAEPLSSALRLRPADHGPHLHTSPPLAGGGKVMPPLRPPLTSETLPTKSV